MFVVVVNYIGFFSKLYVYWESVPKGQGLPGMPKKGSRKGGKQGKSDIESSDGFSPKKKKKREISSCQKVAY